jgi:His-Xaa-Ser system radical SAM maturase HxsB
MVYYLTENFLKDKPYIVNKFCSHKFDGDHILITTDHGSWVVLSNEENELLLNNKVEEDLHLFDVLEEKGIILTEKNKNNLIETFRERYSYLSNGIGLHIIAPTLRCNQRCVYCHANSRDLNAKEYDMDEDTAKSVVDFIFQTPAKFVTMEFQGGEPLILFPILQYIIEYAKKKNSATHHEMGWWSGDKKISFTVVTNLTLMDDDMLKYFLDSKVQISTSLDGPKELHDKNRPYRSGKGSYEDVVNWIGTIKKQCPELGALPTITKFSLPYAKEIVDEYIKNKFSRIKMREMNVAGMAINAWKEIGYTSEEFMKFWKEYLEYVIAVNRRGIIIRDEGSRDLLRRILCRKSALNACLNSPCGVGTIQCAYNHKGDVYTCDEARSDETFKLGNVREKNYKEIFTSKTVENFIRLSSCSSFLCDSCVWHSYCSPCLVSAYGKQNSMVPRFPNFGCEIRGEQTKEIFKKLILSNDRGTLMQWLAQAG